MRVLGLDPGTRKLSYALIDDDKLQVAATYEASNEITRPAQLFNISVWAGHLIDSLQPDWVWIESIIVGNNRKYSIMLAEVYGAALARIYESELGIGTVDNKQWKREIVGNGNASKDQIAEFVRSTYPKDATLCQDQDQIDASCIARYGIEIVSKAHGLRLD